MKKVGIVYTSKYGHTKQYADWLVGHLGKDNADAINVATFNPTQLLAYKLIIFASGVYGDKMPIMDFVKKNIMGIATAKTMFLAVSWYTNDSEEAVQKLTEENYPDQFKGKVPMYVVNSGIDLKKIPVVDKGKLMASKLMIERKDGRSNDDINILSIMKGYFDPTSEENLATIKNAIDEFFNPDKKSDKAAAEPAPAAKPAEKAAPAVSAAAAAVAAAPKPESEPPKPQRVMDASEMQSDLDALSSLENAFKNLKAPRTSPRVTTPAPEAEVKPEPIPEPAAEVKPEPIPEPVVEVKPEPIPEPVVEVKAEPIPEPVVEVKPEPIPEPVVEVKPEPTSEPAFEFRPLPQSSPVEEVRTEPAAKAAELSPAFEMDDEKSGGFAPIKNIDLDFGMEDPMDDISESSSNMVNIDLSMDMSAEEKPAPVEVKPEPVAEVIPEPAPKKTESKNSYMELFAKRRRKAAEEAAPVEEPVAEIRPEPIPEPVAEFNPEPIPEPAVETKAEPVSEAKPADITIEKPKQTEHVAAVDVLSEFDFISEPVSEPAPVKPVEKAIADASPVPSADTMDVYDFMTDSKPKASSRALNAVQDLAKAKAEAEAEKARAKAEAEKIAAEAVKEAFAARAEVKASEPAKDNLIEKMKHDMAALAAESEIEIEHNHDAPAESDELDGFTFSNELDYDVSTIEIDTPPIAPVSLETIHTFDDFGSKSKKDSNLDLKKLQDEINASIASNRANKEKMNNRYAKKQKAETYNPFAVQFEEDESKNKKKKKQEVEHKRLADPIDPDVFFSRPSKNEDWMMPSDTMPEIKFKRR